MGVAARVEITGIARKHILALARNTFSLISTCPARMLEACLQSALRLGGLANAGSSRPDEL